MLPHQFPNKSMMSRAVKKLLFSAPGVLMIYLIQLFMPKKKEQQTGFCGIC